MASQIEKAASAKLSSFSVQNLIIQFMIKLIIYDIYKLHERKFALKLSHYPKISSLA
jgi:hypothetical protein